MMASPRKPAPLRPGDRVAVVAPSGPFQEACFEQGVAWLRGLELEPVWGDDLHNRYRYMAGSDVQRARALQEAFADPTVHGVLCARGGYGAARLLPHLDVSAIKPHCKVFVGFSDVTTLHLFFQEVCGWVTFHGPMVASRWAGEGFDPVTTASFLEAVTAVAPVSPMDVPQARVLHGGKTQGRLVGGNLSLLCHSIGTAYEVDTEAAILLIEDVHEPPYRIDRMLTHLRQAGKLTGVRGIVVGDLLDCVGGRDDDYTVEDVVAECLSDLQIPVVTGFPISHGRPNHTVALGIQVELDADQRTLTPQESATLPPTPCSRLPEGRP